MLRTNDEPDPKITPHASAVDADQAKHLILYVDINGTLIAADSAKRKGLEDAIQQLLAEHYISTWSANNVSAKDITFRAYVDTYLCPGDNNDPEVKQARMTHYANFIEFLTTTNHPLKDHITSEYQSIMARFADGNVFKSFINLIKHLEESKANYTIVLRTFGKDVDATINEINRRTGLSFSNTAKFESGELHLANGTVAATATEMLQCTEPHKHTVWLDNWSDWHRSGEVYKAAKPFPVDLKNHRQVCVFFDDNVQKQIINVCTTVGEITNQNEVQKTLMDFGRIIAVDTLKAIRDETYFIKHVEFAMSTRFVVPTHCYRLATSPKVSGHHASMFTSASNHDFFDDLSSSRSRNSDPSFITATGSDKSLDDTSASPGHTPDSPVTGFRMSFGGGTE